MSDMPTEKLRGHKPYRKHFVKADEPKPMRVQLRDIDIGRAVGSFRFLSSQQIATLFGMSPRAAQRRLALMFDNGLLDRPVAQRTRLLAGRNQPIVYGLGRAGARLLAEANDVAANHLDWTQKNARAGALFIAHTLETADTMMAFHLAAKPRDDLAILDHFDLLKYFPAETQTAKNPFGVTVDIHDPKSHGTTSVGLVPDRLFSLVFRSTAHHYALEIDRGHMPVVRPNSNGTSFARKMRAYLATNLARLHTERWGFSSFRILTVAPSAERIETMIKALEDITDGYGSSLFLFAERDRLIGADPLTFTWLSGKRRELSLLPATASPGNSIQPDALTRGT